MAFPLKSKEEKEQGRAALAEEMAPEEAVGAEQDALPENGEEAPPTGRGSLPPQGSDSAMVTIPADVFRQLMQAVMAAQGPSTMAEGPPPAGAAEAGGDEIPPEMLAMLIHKQQGG
jgi:hypothetical protein